MGENHKTRAHSTDGVFHISGTVSVLKIGW